jgi:hypothetical protein
LARILQIIGNNNNDVSRLTSNIADDRFIAQVDRQHKNLTFTCKLKVGHFLQELIIPTFFWDSTSAAQNDGGTNESVTTKES